ncbi:MAG: CHAT domain-containing protein [Oscillochloris sp.]|nr:CHAT domain-containing protein [Oscillochloris sp.]
MIIDSLLQAYAADPTIRLTLPVEAEAQRDLFAIAMVEIETALDTNQVARAEQVVALTWRIAEQTSNSEYLARAHWCAGMALLNWAHARALEHYAAARSFFDQHGPADDCARVLLGYGMAAGFLGRLDDAEDALQLAMLKLAPLPDHAHWMRLYLNLSLVVGLRGRFAEMRDYAQQAAAAAAIHQHRLIQASALVNQGIAAIALGQLDDAETALHAGLAYAGDTAEVGGRALVNLARLALYRGQLFAALSLLGEARARFMAVQLDIDLATIAIEAAGLYERLQMPREAQQQAIFAAEAFAQAGLPPESVEARLLAIRLALARGRTREARYHLSEAQRLADAVAPTWQALLQGYAAAPLLLDKPAHLPAALAQADTASAALRDLGTLAEQLDLALLGASLAARLHLADAQGRYRQIVELARTYGLLVIEQRACTALADLLSLREAYAPLRRAADLLSEQRRQMPVEELKASLLSGSRTVYARLIEAQLSHRQPLAAAETLIEAKGGPWADLVAPAPLPPPNEAWLAARTNLNTWQEEYRFADDPSYQALCTQRISAAELDLAEATRQQARQRQPQLVPSIEQIQANMLPDQVVIDLLVGTTCVYACLFLPTAPPRWISLCKVQPLYDILDRLDLLLTSLRAGATPAQRKAAATTQRQLSDNLLAQVYHLLITPLHNLLGTANQLFIAPDDRLFDLPWAALTGSNGYLGDQYDLCLLPSAAVLGLQASPPVQQPGLPLALGYAGDPPLAHVDAELAALYQALPTFHCRTPATTADLRDVAAPDLLHIAAHGQIRRDAPLLSQLSLADGPLRLAEVLNLNLHGTRLVTLSACDSGTLPDRGGALLALSGAFLVAGAECVLASLWPVEDEATRLLMGVFYSALQSGATFPQALQQARHDLRRQGYDHPIYWAAFQLLARRK